MSAQYRYRLYKLRQADELRTAQHRQLVQQAQAAQPVNAVYRAALAQVGQTLVAVGQWLQPQPTPEKVQRRSLFTR